MKNNIFRINHFAITVSNLEKTREFYENILGFEFVDKHEDMSLPYYGDLMGIPNAKFKIMNLKGYGIILECIEFIYPKQINIDMKVNINGTAHIAFQAKDVPKLYEEWEKKGVNFCAKRAVCIEEGHHKGYHAFFFKDPDGFTLEVMSEPE